MTVLHLHWIQTLELALTGFSLICVGSPELLGTSMKTSPAVGAAPTYSTWEMLNYLRKVEDNLEIRNKT